MSDLKDIGITVEHLIAARDAMESWVDAFRDADPDDLETQAKCDRAEIVAQHFSRIIDEMQKPARPILKLVKPEDVN